MNFASTYIGVFPEFPHDAQFSERSASVLAVFKDVLNLLDSILFALTRGLNDNRSGSIAEVLLELILFRQLEYLFFLD